MPTLIQLKYCINSLFNFIHWTIGYVYSALLN